MFTGTVADKPHVELFKTVIDPTKHAPEIAKATKRTLSKTPSGWSLGNKVFTPTELSNLYGTIMENKTLYIIPYKFQTTYGIKITDSPYLATATLHFMEDVGLEVLSTIIQGEGVGLGLYVEIYAEGMAEEEMEMESIPLTYNTDLLNVVKKGES